MDTHLRNLWKHADRLVQRYRSRGKRHSDLMKAKRQFKLMREYQLQLQSEAWHSTRDRLSRVLGLQSLRRIFRSFSGEGKGLPPLTELFMKADPATVDKEVITSFSPHASLTPPTPPDVRIIPELDPDLDRPFRTGEMLAATKQGHPRSAPGHDRITWQELRNLGKQAQDALLEVINGLWASGTVPEELKLSLIYPIPKPGKDPKLPSNLRPISLTSTPCKLIEQMIHTRISYYLELVRPGYHPAQAGFRPNLGNHDCLWLLRRVINRTERTALPDYLLAVDMQKAFDNVRHDVLLEELDNRYPSQRIQTWIRNFLVERPIRLSAMAPGWTPRT